MLYPCFSPHGKLYGSVLNAASEMLRLEERAAQACERIRKELDYYFVAVQMTHPNSKVYPHDLRR
jgi:hypothetical protein